MGGLSPVALAVVIVLVLAAIGGIAAVIRHSTTYRSYQDLAVDAQNIAKAVKGEVFRDGDDLVMSGNHGPWPVVVRFSYSETMPGLDIRMEAPAGFTLWVSPRVAAASEGRAVLRIPDPMFDARFSTRSDHPTQANMLLGSKQVIAALQKLCCSANTFFQISSGTLELSEQLIPRPYTGQHVLDHVAALGRMAEFLKSMPGAEDFKIRPIRREHHVVGRLMIAAGVLATIVTVVAATRNPPGEQLEVTLPTVPQGVLPVEAAKIPGVETYRLAAGEDFDPAAAAWLRGQGAQPAGRVAANFAGQGEARDAAYLLVDKDGGRRLVVLAGGANRYDVKLPYAGLIARIPKFAVNSIQWVGRPPEAFDGDGLLLVRRPDDPASGLVLFISGPRVLSAVPVNYQSISLY
jgi:hypothetical protein